MTHLEAQIFQERVDKICSFRQNQFGSKQTVILKLTIHTQSSVAEKLSRSRRVSQVQNTIERDIYVTSCGLERGEIHKTKETVGGLVSVGAIR
jgi:hypothetical protein